MAVGRIIDGEDKKEDGKICKKPFYALDMGIKGNCWGGGVD